MGDFESLLNGSSRADPQVSEALVRQYYDRIYRLACSILADPAEADDVTQTTFIRAYQELDQYQPGGNFRAWLYTIAINLCRDTLRRQKARRRLSQSVLGLFRLHDPEPSPEDTIIQDEHDRELWQAVQELDEKQRLAIVLRFAHGLPLNEIAQILQIKEGTVSSRLHYAIRRLQNRFEAAGNPSGGDE